jgi:dihydropteroate synthase
MRLRSTTMSARVPIEQHFPRPSVMGVLNVTPDSFSDGGVHLDPHMAVAAAQRMVAEGAAIVDVGGESTRPGSAGVDLDEELRRVVPVLEGLGGVLPVSIDTARAEVARRALMHMQGEPRTMQDDPRYDDVAGEVAGFLERRLAFAVAEGIDEQLVCLDPGIGFGKTVEQNFELIRRLDVLLALGRPVLVGTSRKSSLGRILGDPEAKTGTTAASLGAAVAAYERGATVIRAHDVRAHVEALTAARAVVACP